jgi:hypothetical protein
MPAKNDSSPKRLNIVDAISISPNEPLYLAKDRFQSLIDHLWRSGYRVVGPRVRSGAIVYDEVRRVDELPRGWTERQSAGKYRLERSGDHQWFGFNVGPHSWKRYLFPPHAVVATADRDGNGWRMNDVADDEKPYAFLGVRACELAAIAVQDRTFMHDRYVDPIYAKRRREAILIAVNCTQAASTCFCTSMDTGPRCAAGFDIAMTELEDGFTVDIGSPRGRELLENVATVTARGERLEAAEAARQKAVDQIDKRLDTTDIRDLLLGNLDHPHWDDVAERCLS